MRDDAYELLGVSPSADEAEIKRAFRRLARRVHPDVSGAVRGDARFREVRAAYEELIDPEARAALDRRRGPEPPRPEPGSRRARGFRTSGRGRFDLFEELYDRAFRSFGRSGARTFDMDAALTPGEARRGVSVPFRFHLGPTLVFRELRVPAGVQTGDRLSYVVEVAPGVELQVRLHVEIS